MVFSVAGEKPEPKLGESLTILETEGKVAYGCVRVGSLLDAVSDANEMIEYDSYEKIFIQAPSDPNKFKQVSKDKTGQIVDSWVDEVEAKKIGKKYDLSLGRGR